LRNSKFLTIEDPRDKSTSIPEIRPLNDGGDNINVSITPKDLPSWSYAMPRRLSLVVLFLLLLSTLAHAQGRRFQDVLLVETFDADGNGYLDRAERDLAREAIPSRPQRRRRGPAPVDMPRPESNDDALRLSPKDVKSYGELSLYDHNALRTLFFTIDGNDWHDELVAFHGTDVEVPAMLTVDGKQIGEVGLHYRGNTSFDHPAKKSFGVSIDGIDEDLRLDGYRTLNLLNANSDNSMMREVLFSNIAGDFMPAPKANFALVVVNGVYLGVYGNVQQINKDFTKEHYGTKQGVRWKVPPDFSGGAALTYHGPNIADYKQGYELKSAKATDEDWRDLVELCRVLAETPEDEIEAVLPKYLDIDEVLWFLALDNVFMDSDGYYSRGSDYYLYKNPDGIFHLLHYDNNETFGGGRGRGGPPPGGPGFERDFDREQPTRRRRSDRPRPRSQQSPDERRNAEDRARDRAFEPPPGRPEGDRGGPGGGRGGPGGGRGGGGGGPTQEPLALINDLDTRPVIARILSVEAWRETYLERVRELATTQLAWRTLQKRTNHWQRQLRDALKVDPFFVEIEQFDKAIDGPTNSLKANTEQRRQFLLDHPSLNGTSG
jgi:hypothetical protein